MCQTPQLLPAGTYTISVTLTNDYVLQSTINSDGLSSNQSLSPPTFQINTGVNGGNTMTFNGQQVLADTVNNLVALGGTSQQVWNFVPVNCDNQNPYYINNGGDHLWNITSRQFNGVTDPTAVTLGGCGGVPPCCTQFTVTKIA